MYSISQVSRALCVSTRALRYWEQMGLIQSVKQPENGYRTYDRAAIQRAEQIAVLRRLRIPIRQIGVILDAPGAQPAIGAVEAALAQTDQTLETAAQLRAVQQQFLHLLAQNGSGGVQKALEDPALHSLLPALPAQTLQYKEEKWMPETLLYPQRTVFLPPMTVACARYFGQEPENHAFALLAAFIRAGDLPGRKPDFRIFGFNNPSIPNEKGEYGYEYWATVPQDLAVPAPLTRRDFAGGLYLAHTIRMGDFGQWKPFAEQAQASERYRPVGREPEGMCGALEEHLNAYDYFVNFQDDTRPFDQLDLMIPVEKK